MATQETIRYNCSTPERKQPRRHPNQKKKSNLLLLAANYSNKSQPHKKSKWKNMNKISNLFNRPKKKGFLE